MNDMTPDRDPFDEALAAIALRKAWAESLCYALSQCHPDDAVQIMTAALQDMVIGSPVPAFSQLADSLKQDAEWWLAYVSDLEAQVFLEAIIDHIGNRALGIAARKRFIATLWNGLDERDRDAFLARFGRVAV